MPGSAGPRGLCPVVANLHITPQVAGVMATGHFPTSVDPARVRQVAGLMLEFGELRQAFNATVLIGS